MAHEFPALLDAVSTKLHLTGKDTFANESLSMIAFPTRVTEHATWETVSSAMEKRETFVQAVSKELIGEFLQFVQLDVSFKFSSIVILTVNVKYFSEIIMSTNEI